MALITLPATFKPRTCSLELFVNQRGNAAPFGGSEQVLDLLNDRWLLTCALPEGHQFKGAAIEAFIGALRGKVNTVALWHFVRPFPRGTIAGAKTLSAAAAQGASSISITATGTVLAGDMLGVSGLLLMAANDATSVAGVITVPLVNRLRKALSSGAAVITDKPTANFRLHATSGVQYGPGYSSGATFDFAEDI